MHSSALPTLQCSGLSRRLCSPSGIRTRYAFLIGSYTTRCAPGVLLVLGFSPRTSGLQVEDGNRTHVDGFAGRYIATLSLRRIGRAGLPPASEGTYWYPISLATSTALIGCSLSACRHASVRCVVGCYTSRTPPQGLTGCVLVTLSRRDHFAPCGVPISSRPNHREPVGTLGPMFSTLIQSLPRSARTDPTGTQGLEPCSFVINSHAPSPGRLDANLVVLDNPCAEVITDDHYQGHSTPAGIRTQDFRIKSPLL